MMDETDQDSFIYYNCVVRNPELNPANPTDLVEARYASTRVEEIINNPSEYELAVVRFNVPNRTIPLFFFQDGEYKVTLSYDGVDITKDVIYVPAFVGAPQLYGDQAVYRYRDFLDMINTALSDAFIDLKAAKPLAPPTQPPFAYYDPDSGRMSIWAEQLYDSTGPATIEIYMNEALYRYFTGLQGVASPTPIKYIRITVKDQITNSKTYNGQPYYEMSQEASTLYLWKTLVSILFETDTIPVSPEYIGEEKGERRVITDFQPTQADPDNENYQFFPQGPLRYYALKSNFPMREINVRALWQDNQGRVFPIYLAGDDVFSIKLKFRKVKKEYTSDD